MIARGSGWVRPLPHLDGGPARTGARALPLRASFTLNVCDSWADGSRCQPADPAPGTGWDGLHACETRIRQKCLPDAAWPVIAARQQPKCAAPARRAVPPLYRSFLLLPLLQWCSPILSTPLIPISRPVLLPSSCPVEPFNLASPRSALAARCPLPRPALPWTRPTTASRSSANALLNSTKAGAQPGLPRPARRPTISPLTIWPA